MVGSDKAEVRTTGSPLTADEEYNLQVLATDQNAPQGLMQRASAIVRIKAGERPPQFMEQSYSVTFQEMNNVDQK